MKFAKRVFVPWYNSLGSDFKVESEEIDKIKTLVRNTIVRISLGNSNR